MASIAFPSVVKQATLSDGTQYGYVYVPAQSGKKTLLLLYGFPSSSYDWRNQISDLPKLVYGVLVPDLLGYGDIDKPLEGEAYALNSIGRHILELLALEGIDQVVGIGYDYGSVVLSHLIVHHRSRFDGIIFATVGFVDPGGKLDMDTLKAINAETKQHLGESTSGYVELFLRDDAANVLEGAPLNWFRRMVILGPSKEDAALTDSDKEFTLPSLYILCENDWVTHEQWHLYETTRYAKNLELKRLQSAHWVMLEKREEFNENLHA